MGYSLLYPVVNDFGGSGATDADRCLPLLDSFTVLLMEFTAPDLDVSFFFFLSPCSTSAGLLALPSDWKLNLCNKFLFLLFIESDFFSSVSWLLTNCSR